MKVKQLTPVKVFRNRTEDLTDLMKLQILELFIKNAPDLLAKDEKPEGRANIRKNLKEIHANESITLENGEVKEFSKWPLDKLARVMVTRGMSCQIKTSNYGATISGQYRQCRVRGGI